MLAHLKAAITAVARWWVGMSVSDRRQARQRALTIGACAAVFAFGGPLVAQRFGDQKSQEVFLNEAAVLAETIAAEQGFETASLEPGLFYNRAQVSALPEAATFEAQPAAFAFDDGLVDLLGGLTLRARDSIAIKGMVDFTMDDLGAFTGADRQLDCLSRAVYYEARSEDTAGQMAVAEVVMNRVRDPRFPKTICEVVYQGQYRNTGCQFTFTCDGAARIKPKGASWDRAKDIALHVMLGLNTPMTNKATHYHTDYVNPYWAPGLVETAEIGTHIFYRFPKTTKEWTAARIALDARRQDDAIADALAGGEELPLGLDADLDDVSADTLATLITVAAETEEPLARVPESAAAEQRPL
jgi:hypothetical protein